MSEEFALMVEELVDQIAPVRPWWSRQLSTEQMLWRWIDIRLPIMSWLTQVGLYCGWTTPELLLEHLEDVWLSMLPIDMVPMQIQIAVPQQLLMLVQAGPYDAANHIRRMEKEVERRSAAITKLGKPTLTEPQERPPSPPLMGSVLNSRGESLPI